MFCICSYCCRLRGALNVVIGGLAAVLLVFAAFEGVHNNPDLPLELKQALMFLTLFLEGAFIALSIFAGQGFVLGWPQGWL